ncbi:hypothetical protein FSP39_000005 [Pinctada imbricata]|uniref:Zinc transporter ZIP12 n=1 Tax=Pinctada imbricata TaxID=66713 RepID=A0AA88XEL1_PINIB|nr:hypothetical protein FSP39_000005 [Pinctada imbricata]
MHDASTDPSMDPVYGYGTLANVCCCLCSLGGAVILPCASHHKVAYNVVLSVFYGLAVGTLASDALLHLIPEAFGLHNHGEEEKANKVEGGFRVESHVRSGLIAMLGIYLFYLLEMVMTYIQSRYGYLDVNDNDIEDPTSMGTANDGASKLNISDNFDKLDESESEQGSTEPEVTVEQTQLKKTKFSPLVIMIIVGDAIHNFADGLAIAAAFSRSSIDGLSITIAIICHELPHELGDFAVLMSSGMGFTKALLANLFSSLTALVGFYIGVPLSKNDFAKEWIFAIAAGMFLYISLVDMLPTLVKKGRGNWRTIMFHNIGIFFGALIIILLSMFEEEIRF